MRPEKEVASRREDVKSRKPVAPWLVAMRLVAECEGKMEGYYWFFFWLNRSYQISKQCM